MPEEAPTSPAATSTAASDQVSNLNAALQAERARVSELVKELQTVRSSLETVTKDKESAENKITEIQAQQESDAKRTFALGILNETGVHLHDPNVFFAKGYFDADAMVDMEDKAATKAAMIEVTKANSWLLKGVPSDATAPRPATGLAQSATAAPPPTGRDDNPLSDWTDQLAGFARDNNVNVSRQG
jgi:hypothetical protein